MTNADRLAYNRLLAELGLNHDAADADDTLQDELADASEVVRGALKWAFDRVNQPQPVRQKDQTGRQVRPQK